MYIINAILSPDNMPDLLSPGLPWWSSIVSSVRWVGSQFESVVVIILPLCHNLTPCCCWNCISIELLSNVVLFTEQHVQHSYSCLHICRQLTTQTHGYLPNYIKAHRQWLMATVRCIIMMWSDLSQFSVTTIFWKNFNCICSRNLNFISPFDGQVISF